MKKTIVYIMGYGRSGSTLTDIILNQHEHITSVGALNNLYDWIKADELCACGSTLGDCDFWNNIIRNSSFMESMGKDSFDQRYTEGLRGYLSSIFRKPSAHTVSSYIDRQKEIFDAIFANTASNFIVDSSKSTNDCIGRAYMLSQIKDYDFKAIFLVRDSAAVAWSAIKKRGSPERKRYTENRIYNLLRTTFSWLATNILTLHLVKKLGRENVFFLRYEDLCTDPKYELENLGLFLNLNIDSVSSAINSNAELSIGHNLGGNGLRFKPSIKLKIDNDWKENMPTSYVFFNKAVCYPVNKILRKRYDG